MLREPVRRAQSVHGGGKVGARNGPHDLPLVPVDAPVSSPALHLPLAHRAPALRGFFPEMGHGAEQALDLRFVALAERNPCPVNDKVRIVASPLRFFFADTLGQNRIGLLKGKETMRANDRARTEAIMISEGLAFPLGEGYAER